MNEDVFMEQLRLRRLYWNGLVELHNRYLIDRYREITWVPERDVLDGMYKELEELREQLKQGRQKCRGTGSDKTKHGKELKAKIKKLEKEAGRYYRDVYKPAYQKHKAQEHIKQELAANDQEFSERWKQLRCEMVEQGLYWGNYDDINRNYDCYIRRQSLRKGRHLKFRRWDGTGKVHLRLMRDMILSASEVFDGKSNWVQIAPVDERAWTSESRRERRRHCWTKIRVRIQSEGRRPVWGELPMCMHRPLPAGEIRTVSVRREVIAGWPRYSVSIGVMVPDVPCKPDDSRPSVALDIGWRRLDKNRVRVAYWYSSDGAHGEVIMEEETVSQFLKVDDLRSIRDNYFNEIKEKLVSFVRNNNIPEWLKEERYIWSPRWRSIVKLVKLVKKWERFSGDEEIYRELECWYRRERHLYQYEANLRDQIHARRWEQYRVFSSRVARWFGRVYMEDIDLSRMSRKPKPEDGTAVSTLPNRYRVIAAPGEFRSILESACKREGIYVKRIEPQHTTQECHGCGRVEKFNASAMLERECPHCGLRWDQDFNAAKNILERGLDEDVPERERLMAAV